MTFSFARGLVRLTHVIYHGSLLASTVPVASTLPIGYGTYDSITRKIANAITPYRIDTMQDNFASREQIAQPKGGVTCDRTRLVLGTPLLADMSHVNRWGYIFPSKRGNTSAVQERQLTVWFGDDHLAEWVGADELSSESELISGTDDIRRPKKDAAQATAAVDAVPTARAPSIPSAGVTNHMQSIASSKNSVDVTLLGRHTGGGGTDTSVPPPVVTSP